jgi:uncharacterized iron-regulated protein
VVSHNWRGRKPSIVSFHRFWIAAIAIGLLGCAATGPDPRQPAPFPAAQLAQLLPADAILLGEQHDAPDHQRIHRWVVETLSTRHTLAALALEMANRGQSTDNLGPNATEDQVRAALQWNDEAWPWTAYGPIVMVAVRAGVPVLGANLPTAGLRDAMANTAYDQLLSGPALKAQQQNIRRGHCELLPESQISPMTRIQIARDVEMSKTLINAARPGKTVVLLAGSGHVNRRLGVPQHLPHDFRVKSVLLQADKASVAIQNRADFDDIWPAAPAPPVDYCANFIASRATPAATSPREKMP